MFDVRFCLISTSNMLRLSANKFDDDVPIICNSCSLANHLSVVVVVAFVAIVAAVAVAKESTMLTLVAVSSFARISRLALRSVENVQRSRTDAALPTAIND